MKSRKAQGLSMQVIIIAIICLIVLAVLIFIFVGKIGIWGKSVADCEAKGGECANACKPDEAKIAGICPEEAGQFCCIPLETE